MGPYLILAINAKAGRASRVNTGSINILLVLIGLLFSPGSYKGQKRESASVLKLQESTNSWNTKPGGLPKLVKTQGTNEYASICDAIEDRQGNIWFATTGEGVYRYDGREFIQFTEKDGLSNNHVFCVISDNSGKLWFGTGDGITTYDNGKFEQIPIHVIKSEIVPHKKSIIDAYGKPLPYDNYVWSLLKDSKGTIWLGTFSDVYRYNGTGFTAFAQKPNLLQKNVTSLRGIESMVEDRKGNIWFGARNPEGGVFMYDGVKIQRLSAGNTDWLMPDAVDNEGNIWFWGSGAPCKYDGNTFTSLPARLFSDWVYKIGTDLHGTIWLGYLGAGVYSYDGKKTEFFGANEGFDKRGVSCIFADKQGFVWFGTKSVGLIRYDGQKFMKFSE